MNTEHATLQQAIHSLLQQSDLDIAETLKPFSTETLWSSLSESPWWQDLKSNFRAIQVLHYVLTQNLRKKLSSPDATKMSEALFESLQVTQA